MALFGLGWGISKAAGIVAGIMGKDEETRKGFELTAAVLSMGIDPVGSLAALGMLGIKEGAKNGSGICQAIVIGTGVVNAIDTLASGASVNDAISES